VRPSFVAGELLDALYGVLGVYAPFDEDERGVRHFGTATTARDPKAPVVPAHQCPDRAQFVDPCRKVSAVWLLRLDGAYGLSKCLPNPKPMAVVADNSLFAVTIAARHNDGLGSS